MTFEEIANRPRGFVMNLTQFLVPAERIVLQKFSAGNELKEKESVVGIHAVVPERLDEGAKPSDQEV